MPARVMTYEWWADHYHFTRRQVDEDIGLEDFFWFPKIAAAKAKAAEIARRPSPQRGRGRQQHPF